MKRNQLIFRSYLIVVFFIILFFALFFKLYYLQFVEHSRFSKKAQRQHHITINPQRARGMIFDCQGKPLAISVEVDSIYAAPKQIKDPSSYARRIKSLIKKDSRWIKRQLSKDCYFVWLARKVSPECSEAVQRLNLEGISIFKEYRRFYPQGTLAANLLGFVGMDNQGLEGLERYYESELSPTLRKSLVQRDALGQKITLDKEEIFSRRPFNLTLTIDSTIQHIAQKEVDKVFQKTEAKGAQLVVMRPSSGEILALVNRPTFNSNQPSDYSPLHWRNRVVTDCYEPGSSFKVIPAAAALEENVVTPQKIFFCENGSFQFCRRVIHDHEPRGWLTFRQILGYSSNIGMTKASLLLGKHKLYKYIQQFGCGRYTDVDMPGEIKGNLRPIKEWTKSSLGAIPYGQEISVTSMQLINIFSTIANGGLMMQPYVLREIRDKKGALIKKFNPHIKRRVISPQTALTLTEMLEGAVISGTGKLAQVSGYRVAGKTGTAQKFDVEKNQYSKEKSIVSFVGFAPVEEPAIAVLVMVDEPRGVAWGGTVAAPIFSRVVGKTLSYLQISPQEERKAKKRGKQFLSSLEVLPKAEKLIGQTMPDLKGASIRESLENLSMFNLEINIQGSGFLYWQRPSPGEKLNQGDYCLLKFMPGCY